MLVIKNKFEKWKISVDGETKTLLVKIGDNPIKVLPDGRVVLIGTEVNKKGEMPEVAGRTLESIQIVEEKLVTRIPMNQVTDFGVSWEPKLVKA